MPDTLPEFLDHNGVHIPNDPQIITRQISRAIRAGRYEKDEMRGLPKFIRPEDRIVELGAGLGFVSSFIGVHLGVTETLCIEANPALCDFIPATHAMNGLNGIQVRNAVAVNDPTPEHATMPFYVRDPFWGSSLSGSDDFVDKVDVPVISLSRTLHDFAATTLIVDIEGGEVDLFDGLDFGPVSKVYFELHTRYIRQIGVKRCFDALSAAGFAYDQKVSAGGSVLFRKIPDRQLSQ